MYAMTALDSQKLKETIKQGKNIFSADNSMNISSANVPFDQSINQSTLLVKDQKRQKSNDPNEKLEKSMVFGSPSNLTSPSVSPERF